MNAHTKQKQRTRTRNEELDDMVGDLSAKCRLDSWNALVQEVQVPSELLPALMTSRPELLAILKPRSLSEEECAAIYKLLAVLIETNFALRTHAEQLALLTHNWADLFKGLHGTGDRIMRFARFEKIGADESDQS